MRNFLEKTAAILPFGTTPVKFLPGTARCILLSALVLGILSFSLSGAFANESSFAFVQNGQEKLLKGDLDGALEEFKKAIAIDPGDPLVYNNTASIYLRKGDFKTARTYLEKAVELAPKECIPLTNLGYAYVKLGMKKEAIKAFEKNLLLCPGDPKAASWLEHLKK